jgi:hypothetical protein
VKKRERRKEKEGEKEGEERKEKEEKKRKRKKYIDNGALHSPKIAPWLHSLVPDRQCKLESGFPPCLSSAILLLLAAHGRPAQIPVLVLHD